MSVNLHQVIKTFHRTHSLLQKVLTLSSLHFGCVNLKKIALFYQSRQICPKLRLYVDKTKHFRHIQKKMIIFPIRYMP